MGAGIPPALIIKYRPARRPVDQVLICLVPWDGVTTFHPIIRLLRGLVNLVEDAAVTKMFRLRLCPTAEDRVVNGDELNVRQLLQ